MHPTMNLRSIDTHSLGLFAQVALGCSCLSFALAAELGEQEILQTARDRIEQHRKADTTLWVIDQQGRPVPDVTLSIRQTRHRFLFGSNIFQWGKLRESEWESAYRRRFAELLNYATIGFYWPSYEPRQGEPRHEYAEAVAEWCREQGITAKGHPLAWNYSEPRWLPQDLDAIYRLQLARIDDCVRRFPGLIDRWDVVNEVTHYDRDEMMKRRAPTYSAMWKKYGQIEFTRDCFAEARQAGPKDLLLINDYRTDPAYEEVIEQLVDDQGKPLYDAIGLQSHMHSETWSNRKLWDVCEHFSRFGVPLHFTETTVLSGDKAFEHPQPWPSTPEGERWQAEEVVRIYTVLFSHPAVEAITWWDFCDFFSWKKAPAGLLRRDMSPKPVYEALHALIKDQWWTRLETKTDAEGQATFRGFQGEYQVWVSGLKGEVEMKDFSLLPNAAGPWILQINR